MISRQRMWQLQNPEKARAQMQANEAIKAGKLIRQCCSKCGRPDKVHGHHDDYSKPLDVRWLCAACHRRYHVAYRESFKSKQPATLPSPLRAPVRPIILPWIKDWPFKNAGKNLVVEMVLKQAELELRDGEFAPTVGLTRSQWTYLRHHCSGLNDSLALMTKRSYPELTEAADEYIAGLATTYGMNTWELLDTLEPVSSAETMRSQLIATQRQHGYTGQEIADKLRISSQYWVYVRYGFKPIGVILAEKARSAFPELTHVA